MELYENKGEALDDAGFHFCERCKYRVEGCTEIDGEWLCVGHADEVVDRELSTAQEIEAGSYLGQGNSL